ncbi:myeloperoxidase-like [Erpetoichthys calabaricus]|uniref:myeloperoxidase-like n=1 Tax=Erpetoichthys calabaricus TaxID=27687 RepID=UPI00223483C1|nr:myeloperoxidase-like [Erpetoichthys calabaricus]
MKPLFLTFIFFAFATQTAYAVSDSDESLDDPFIQSALQEAKKMVDEAYKYSRDVDLLKVKKKELTPYELLCFSMRPMEETRTAIRAAEYMEATLDIIRQNMSRIHKRSLGATDHLLPEDLEAIARVTGCAAQIALLTCDTIPFIDQYRTISGVCNNKTNSRLGASNTPFSQLLPVQYDDGISSPRGWTSAVKYSGFSLPLVREVSNKILHTANENLPQDNLYSSMLTLFGLWIGLDLSNTAMSRSIRSFNDGIDCSTSCQQAEPCFPIEIPTNDPRFEDTKSCIPFFQSATACGTGYTGYSFGIPNVRSQINQVTSFIDASMIYGSTDSLANQLRDLTNDFGLMAVNQHYSDDGYDLLPFQNATPNICATRSNVTKDPSVQEVPCFMAGDSHANENIALTAIHTMFLREHNRIAKIFRKLNPHWSGETIYQETRKVIGAFLQTIIYQDYLPIIIGPNAVQKYLSDYRGYDDTVNPSISSVFSTAAFQFAHLTVQPFIFRLNRRYQQHTVYPNVLLHNSFFTPWRIVFEGGVDPIIRGLISMPAKLNRQDKLMHDELRERLFQLTSQDGLDLASLIMQRGRDHGLQGYNAWRGFCGLSQPKDEKELEVVLNNQTLAKTLISLYGTPNNIDVWTGGILEPFVPNGRVGPLFACLIGTQFQKIRDGDRFWWEKEGVFTERQRTTLKKVSLHHIICDNTGIKELPPFVFKYSDEYTSCSEIPMFDFSAWKDTSSDLVLHSDDF